MAMKDNPIFSGSEGAWNGVVHANVGEVERRDWLIRNAGKMLADALEGFYGRVAYNFQNGKLVNINIERTLNCKEQ